MYMERKSVYQPHAIGAATGSQKGNKKSTLSLSMFHLLHCIQCKISGASLHHVCQ